LWTNDFFDSSLNGLMLRFAFAFGPGALAVLGYN